MESLLFLAALLVFAYGLVSALAQRSPLTAPMIFVAVGVLAGPAGVGLMNLEVDSEALAVVAEIALAVILFRDASTLPLQSMGSSYRVPLRLLALGLPLCVIAGLVVAKPLFPDMELAVLLALALILAPTDAALGEVVTSSPQVPASIREAIGVESGLNDGVALPLFFACLALLASPTGAGNGLAFWLSFAARQIAFGAAAGAAIGLIGGRCVDLAASRGWMAEDFQRLAAIALALLAYGFAEMLGGNGFVAAFFAGLLLGIRSPDLRASVQNFGEAEGKLLALLVFLIFGATLVPLAAGFWTLTSLIYALLSLTLIRMLPVAIALIGSRLTIDSVLSIGWFGPRGIASVLYLLLFINQLGTDGYESMLATVVLTVLFSVFLHGVSAAPLSRYFGQKHNGTDSGDSPS